MMRRLKLALLSLALASASIGSPLDVETPGGEPKQLALREGERALIVHFWATWCTECILELPLLATAAARCRDRDVRIVVVNVGEAPSFVARFLEHHGLELQTWFDREASTWRSLRSHGLPTNLTWTSEGRKVEVGPRNVAEWSKALDAVGCRGASEPR
jgi:thiol-disulfide isomerase/thioredoxin